MAEAYYEPTPATDGATMNPVPGAVFQVFEIADTTFSTPLSLRVGSGNPTTTVTASDTLATLPGVYVTSPNFEHIWVSGSFQWRRDSIDGAKGAIERAESSALAAANMAADAERESATSAQAAKDAAALVDAPADIVMRDVAANPDSAFFGQMRSTFVRTMVVDAAYGVNGAANPTTHIQERINTAATFGLEVFIPGGSYKLTAELSIPSGVTIRGAGQGVTIIDMKGLGSTLTAAKTALTASGTISATTHAITADVAKGVKTVTVANASTHFAAGDRVLLSSDQTFHASAALKRGEIKRIEAVTSTVVTFEDATYDSYAAASGAKLAKMAPVRNITLQGFTLEGTDTDNMERGFYCHAGENIVVRDCEFNYLDYNSINLRHVTNFKVTDNTFRNVHWVSNVPNYYGLVVENATAHGIFANNHGTKCRHLFTTGYTVTTPGVTRFIVVEGNVDTYSQSASYDTHDGSEFITITGNTSSFSEANGINTEGRETIITDNIILNYGAAGYGIEVRGAAERCTVRGNRISTSVAGAGSCVYVRKTYAGFKPSRVIVTDNILDVATQHSIYVIDVDAVTIANNILGTVNTSYAIRIHGSKNSKVLGNHSAGGTAFLFLQDCKGTIMSNNSAGANTYGVRMNETTAGLQTDTVIIGNDFTEVLNATKLFNLFGTRKIVANLGVADSAA